MSGSTLTEASHLTPFAERVQDRRIGPCRLLMLHTPVRSVVTWKGSFKASPDFGADEDLHQNLAVSLLDKGTERHDRFAIAEILENRGAQVQFDSDGLNIGFSGRALTEDAPHVLGLVAEQLRQPKFDSSEFEKGRSRAAASIQRSMESTRSQAHGALTRRIYSAAHPNYNPEPSARISRLLEIDVDAVRRYHEEHFGSNELTLVVVGDFDKDVIEDAVRACFGDWKEHKARDTLQASAPSTAPGTSKVPMPDRQNVDVRMGHAIDLLRDDPEYIPMFLSNYVLGGNFSARLMQVIRDELGLTYGIRSGLYGISTDYSGHWQVTVTLSTENLERGLEETIKVVRRFVEDGPTEAELEDKKTTIIGGYKVGLATTAGLAGTLLKNAERGFDIGYLDRFPQEVEGITLDQARDVVRAHLDPGKLQIAMAGMLPELTH